MRSGSEAAAVPDARACCSSAACTAGVTLGHDQGREVFSLPSHHKTTLPPHAGRAALVPLIIGASPTEKVKPASYLVGITQRDANGRTPGAAAVEPSVK